MVFGAALEIVAPEGVPPDSLRDMNWHQRYSIADKPGAALSRSSISSGETRVIRSR